MSYYNKTVSTEERFQKIMEALKLNNEFLTTSEICREYLREPTESDVNSTGQILKVLSLAGLVQKRVDSVPGRRKQILRYWLVRK